MEKAATLAGCKPCSIWKRPGASGRSAAEDARAVCFHSHFPHEADWSGKACEGLKKSSGVPATRPQEGPREKSEAQPRGRALQRVSAWFPVWME